jgi:hypothetical protein
MSYGTDVASRFRQAGVMSVKTQGQEARRPAGSDPTRRGRQKACIVLAPPNWGMGRTGTSLIRSEQFRSTHKTRRRSYGTLSGEPTLEGEVQHEASRVHRAARRRRAGVLPVAYSRAACMQGPLIFTRLVGKKP